MEALRSRCRAAWHITRVDPWKTLNNLKLSHHGLCVRHCIANPLLDPEHPSNSAATGAVGPSLDSIVTSTSIHHRAWAQLWLPSGPDTSFLFSSTESGTKVLKLSRVPITACSCACSCIRPCGAGSKSGGSGGAGVSASTSVGSGGGGGSGVGGSRGFDETHSLSAAQKLLLEDKAASMPAGEELCFGAPKPWTPLAANGRRRALSFVLNNASSMFEAWLGEDDPAMGEQGGGGGGVGDGPRRSLAAGP